MTVDLSDETYMGAEVNVQMLCAKKNLSGPAAMLCFFVIVLTSIDTARAAAVIKFDGTYKLDQAESDNINNAIEGAIKEMNFLVRHFARDRLKKLNPAYNKVAITSSGGEIAIVVDNQPALKAPANGSTVSWKDPEGRETRVSLRLSGGHLLQEFNSSDGQRMNDYTLSADGRTLTMRVTEKSPRLSKPIEYKQVYRRVT